LPSFNLRRNTATTTIDLLAGAGRTFSLRGTRTTMKSL
jgi:hypothetical protein